MHIMGEYVVPRGRHYCYTLQVFQSLGRWTLDGTVRCGGELVATPFHVFDESDVASQLQLDAVVRIWIETYIEARFPPPATPTVEQPSTTSAFTPPPETCARR
ncbi:MAG: hypothetical protein KIT73_10130 [Burkholderiales bacterium]|nr:hypothetical protein [Burkholderiales bacterium]